MIIYTLTETLTQESFSPKQVFTFVSHEQAHKQMIQQVYDYLKKCGDEIPMHELDDPNGYEDGSLCIGYDYARDDSGVALWEIFKNVISVREVIIGNIMGYIRETYKTPERFNDILYSLINEYKDEDLNAIASEGDFVQEHVIGEALYQNALAQLGGKTDEVSYGKILEYLNESDQFINVRCTMFNYWDLPIEEEKLEKWQRWFIGMLTICDGNKTMINLVREDIDDNQPKNDKIFQKELAEEKIGQYKDKLPKNFRELCSTLNDVQYADLINFLFNYNFDFSGDINDLRVLAKRFYEEAMYVISKVVLVYGWDNIQQEYGEYFSLQYNGSEWVIFLNSDYDFVAEGIETMRNQYLF